MGLLGVTPMMMLDKKNLEIADIMLGWTGPFARRGRAAAADVTGAGRREGPGAPRLFVAQCY